MSRENRRRFRKREKEPPPGLYDVPEPDSKAWPQETYCRNVMCRRKWWREFGESEFCVACRTMLHLDEHGRRVE